MMNTTNKCPFCEQFTRLRGFDEYHRDLCVYTPALKLIRYYEQIDDEHCCGQTTYSFDELNFCPVCGKKIPEYMTNRKVQIKGISVKTTSFSEKQSTDFINSELYFDRFTHLPKSSDIPSPTEFYRFIGGKRFLVIADKNALIAGADDPTLHIFHNGEIKDTLCGNLFICGINGEDIPQSLSDEDSRLIFQNIVTASDDDRHRPYIKSIISEGEEK
jgi:hypothetical protein